MAATGYTSLNPANISVSISPKVTGLTVSQNVALIATTNDSAGVSWSMSPSEGSFSLKQSLNGASVTLTAPTTPGLYTLTATSITNPARTASLQVGVTDLQGILTYHNDLARDGVNSQEYVLTPANVNTSTFGKLLSCPVDGAITAQPLWVANLNMSGGRHNAVLVATANDTLYAFDADATTCSQLWSASLIDPAHGGTPGETSFYFTPGTSEIGVLGTPVIDPATQILYAVSKSQSGSIPGTQQSYQRLHAISLLTGREMPGSPVLIQGSYPGSGDGSGVAIFNARMENQRPGLALVNGIVYIAWAANGGDIAPYYGWVMGYRYAGGGFNQTAVLNVTPNTGAGGIWMSGGAPAADASGNLYLITGNGAFDAANAAPPNDDYGDSLLRLSPAPEEAAVNHFDSARTTLPVVQYFTPSDQLSDAANDYDFGAGGAAVLADVKLGNPARTVHLVIGGGKDGSLYVLNRDALGGYGDSNAWQKITAGSGIYSTVAMWHDLLYVVGANGSTISSYALTASNPAAGFVLQSTAHALDAALGMPNNSPSISSSGDTNGILWALDTTHQTCATQQPNCQSAVLHAYDATSMSELWNSLQLSSQDYAGGYSSNFLVPTIANGRVYIGTRGLMAPGELDVYGLKSD